MLCVSCPRMCGAVRSEYAGNGFCKQGYYPRVARVAPHYDEEPCISGTRGTGAIFFSGCSMRCRFCQNMEISRFGKGLSITPARLRQAMDDLIAKGVHGISLVNPTHFADAIIEALDGGLPIPVIWNSGGYERVETLIRLKGLVSVYLPDLKYADAALAERYSGAANYFDFAAPAILEMLRQTGKPVINAEGVMTRGTLIRHLVLPGCIDNSLRVIDWVADNAADAWFSLMAQYVPMGEPVDSLLRRVNKREYEKICKHLFARGITSGYVQEMTAANAKYIPEFFDDTGCFT